LYSITPSASANVLSAIDKVLPSTQVGKPLGSTLSLASALSSASHYSQESWNPDSSKVIPILSFDRRRHAMAFSPSVNLADFPSLEDSETFESQGLTGAMSRGALMSLPLRTPRTPSSARLKMNITLVESPNLDNRPTDSVLGSTVVGSVRVAEEPHPVVAIRRRVMGLDTVPTLVDKQEGDGRQHGNHTLSDSTESVNTYERPHKDILAASENNRGSMQQRLPKKHFGKTGAEAKDDQFHHLPSPRISKRFTTFRKKIGRFSKQPVRKEKQNTGDIFKADVEQTTQPRDPKLSLSKVQLPELHISPIRFAFDPSRRSSPILSNLRAEPVSKVKAEIPPINTSISLNPAPSKPPLQIGDVIPNRPTSSRSTAAIPPLPSHLLSSVIPQAPGKPTSPLSVPVTDMPPVPPLAAHIERRPCVRAPHEAPPSTPHRTSVTPEWRHRRSRSSPAVPQFDFRKHDKDIPPLPPMPPLPKMPMLIPKVKPPEIRTTVPSLPAGVTKLPPPRPPRSKRPPGHLRTQSQPHFAIEGNVDSAEQACWPSLHEPPTQAERWDEIIATTALSARPRGRSFSSSRDTTTCDLSTNGLRPVGRPLTMRPKAQFFH